METLTYIILLMCFGACFSSHSSHTIPVEGYETELHNLGEHVEYPETPVKVIKITKTVAVKVPVPYPVKVIQKVPYPVHINKPYPVPVPQIVHVPQAVAPKANHAHEALDIGHGGGNYQNSPHNSYQVQESQPQGGAHFQFGQDSLSYNAPTYGSYNAPIASEYTGEEPGDAYNQQSPNNDYYESADDHNTLESKNYDQAIQNYLNNRNLNNKNGDAALYHR